MTAMTPEVVILGHHKIGPVPAGYWASWYYVPVAAFAAQLELMRVRGYVPLTLAAFLDGIDRPETLPPKSYLLTFDDGYRSLLEQALPVMRAAGVPGVLFVPTGAVGGTNHFDFNVEPLEAIATWDELAEMERGGLAIQPHGVSHRAFGTLTPAEQDTEVAESKRAIEAHLGRPAELFSFPYGDNSADPATVEQILRRHGYRAAVLYGGAPVPFIPANRYRLTRIAIGSDTHLATELDRL